MAGVHSTFGPSSAARIMQCPASYSLHMSQTSEHAVLGTAAHDIHEKLLKHPEIPASKYLGQAIIVHEGEEKFEVTVDQPMLDAVEESVSRVHDIMNSIEANFVEPTLHVEVRVDISDYTPVEEQFGTSDVIIEGGSHLHIVDYKNGVGVVVPAFENAQMALYALGALKQIADPHLVKTISMHVHQPNAKNFDTWTIHIRELRSFGIEIRDALAKALLPNPPFGPDEKACKFCSVKPTCPALAAKVQQIYGGVFDDVSGGTTQSVDIDFITPPDFKLLPDSELVQAWKSRKLIEMWSEAVSTECEHRLLNGTAIEGLKLVEGRSRREWVNDKQAATYLLGSLHKRDVFTVTMISPAEAEKKLPKADREGLKKLISKKRGSPTVALESDKREVFKPGADAFADLTLLDADDGL